MDSNVRKVYSSLFVSGYEGARESGHKFDKVVSLAAPSKLTDDEFIITDGQHDYRRFENAVDTVVSYLEDGHNVLVNCQAGLSRSVAVCTAAQVVHYELSYVEALQNARFGHRLPEPELLRSSEEYISENVNYVEDRVVEKRKREDLERVFSDLIDKIESDTRVEDSDVIKSHIRNTLDFELN